MLTVAKIGFKGAKSAFAVTVAILSLSGGSVRRAEAYSMSFLCFFDLHSARMTDRCRQVIDHFDEYRRKLLQPQQLEIIGFATDYRRERDNARLSMMRAQAVARELERVGVPSGILCRQGFGSKDPLVPSLMQDPQNRRVEMFIRPE